MIGFGSCRLIGLSVLIAGAASGQEIPRTSEGKPDFTGYWNLPYTPNMAAGKEADVQAAIDRPAQVVENLHRIILVVSDREKTLRAQQALGSVVRVECHTLRPLTSYDLLRALEANRVLNADDDG